MDAPGAAPRLHHERVTAGAADPERWMLVLHGVYGAGRNWATVARRTVGERPEWGAALVDLRQHGRSMGFPPPHTLAAAAADLEELVRGEGLDARAVLGHSMGGKVALLYARRPAAPLEQLWIVDSTPDARPPSGSAWEMLRTLRRVPGVFGERTEGVAALEAEGLASPVAVWMATNLERDGEGRYRWRIDPDELEALLLDFFRTDAWDVVDGPPPGVRVHVVKALDSAVLDEDACRRVEEAGRRTGRVFLHRVAGGHWVNADNPDALVELLLQEL